MAEVKHIMQPDIDNPRFYYCEEPVVSGEFHKTYTESACYYCREEWWLELMLSNEDTDIEYGVSLAEYPSQIASINW